MSLHFSIPFLLSLVSFGCVWTSGASHSHINTSLAPLLPPCCPPPPTPYLSSPLISLFLPFPSHHLPPPRHLLQTHLKSIQALSEKEEMQSTSHAAPAGRKEAFVTALSLSLFISTSCISDFSPTLFLPPHRQPNPSQWLLLPFVPLSLFPISMHSFQGEASSPPLPQGEWFISLSLLFQQSNFSSFAQQV